MGLIVLSLCYLGWAAIGYILTDKYYYFFFDHKQVGWERVGEATGAFLVSTIICKFLAKSSSIPSLINIVFLVVYGLTGFREKLTKRGEERKSGGAYTRLPH